MERNNRKFSYFYRENNQLVSEAEAVRILQDKHENEARTVVEKWKATEQY